MELEDISDLGYTMPRPYVTDEQKENVLGKLDWVILKLYKQKESRKYDYDTVLTLKNRIKMAECSLSEKGIDFLNTITKDLKDDGD